MVGLWIAHRDRARARVPALVPPQHRAAGRRAVDAALQRSRSVVDRNAGQRAGASGAAARALRDRPARRDGQAAPGHAAAAVARIAGDPRAGVEAWPRRRAPALADRWLPGVERALKDPDSAVRIAAVSALAALRGEAAVDVMRPFITRNDPALAIVAAAALAGSTKPDDVAIAEETLRRFSSDTREQGAEWRLQVARALGDVTNPRVPADARAADVRREPRRGAGGDRERRHARRAAISCSCRRWCRCCATAG